jgi:predicted amidophosphoribosyltransferase
MSKNCKRLQRERRTILLMLGIFCRDKHRRHGGLCPECQGLADYAMLRLDRCRFQEAKPTCAKCPVHCYKPALREQVREVMRYAGPRMMLEHPVLAIFHLVDGMRQPPEV